MIAVDHLAGDSGCRIENRRLCGHGNHFGHSAELEAEIGRNDIPDPNDDALSDDRLESLELRFDRVRAGIQIADLVETLRVGNGGRSDVRFDIRRGHRDARQDRARGVFDRSTDTAAKVLGENRSRNEKNYAQQTESKLHGNSSGKNSAFRIRVCVI